MKPEGVSLLVSMCQEDNLRTCEEAAINLEIVPWPPAGYTCPVTSCFPSAAGNSLHPQRWHVWRWQAARRAALNRLCTGLNSVYVYYHKLPKMSNNAPSNGILYASPLQKIVSVYVDNL